MIYTDEDGIVNVEYGHGSVMGYTTAKADDGFINYSLQSTDKHPIGQPCQNFDEIEGKMDSDIGVGVRLRFSKPESIDIIIKDLENIRKSLV